MLPHTNPEGSNGNSCGEFVANEANVAFSILSAPATESYNVQLYHGTASSGGIPVYLYAKDVPIGSGVWFSNLIVGDTYFFKVSSSTAPVPGSISTNNANIRRIRQRIETLEKEAQRAESAAKEPEQGDGFILQENYDIGRIQFLFDDKPDEDTRSLLKSHGFRWAPSEGAWQRLLNDNGRSAARAVKAALEKEA